MIWCGAAITVYVNCSLSAEDEAAALAFDLVVNGLVSEVRK